MPTDTEIWERACERVGLWKQGERCTNCNDAKAYAQEFRGTIGIHTEHDIPAPAIDDPAAVVAIVAWLAPSYAIIKKIGPNWQVNSGNWSPTLPLALANAVLAVPQETQP